MHRRGDRVDHAREDVGARRPEAVVRAPELLNRTVPVRCEDASVRVKRLVLPGDERVRRVAAQILGRDAVVEAVKRAVKLRHRVGRRVEPRDVRVVPAVHAAERVAARHERDHVGLAETGAGEPGPGRLERRVGLRHARRAGLEGVDAARAERHPRAAAARVGNDDAHGQQVSRRGPDGVEIGEETEGVVEGRATILGTVELEPDGAVQTARAGIHVRRRDVVEGGADPFCGELAASNIAAERAWGHAWLACVSLGMSGTGGNPMAGGSC